MTRIQQRAVALSCARYQLRQCGVNPVEASAEDAQAALEEYVLRSPEMVGSQWYRMFSITEYLATPGSVALSVNRSYPYGDEQTTISLHRRFSPG